MVELQPTHSTSETYRTVPGKTIIKITFLKKNNLLKDAFKNCFN